MSPEISTTISIICLLFGATAVWSMLVRFGRQSCSPMLLTTHRVTGWTFALLFIVMLAVMGERMTRHWEQLSPLNTIHCTLAIGVLALLLLKLFIPRFFPGLAKHLFALGVSIFVLAFTLIWISAGYHLILKVRQIPYISHADMANTELDAQRGKQFLIVKCSACHAVKDILKHRISAGEWELVVNRMVKLAAPQITPGEARQIVYFLSTEYGPK